MDKLELKETVDKYNTCNIVFTVWYAIKMWWYFGSVANATRINSK